VEWYVGLSNEENEDSLYYSANRCHVISIDNLNAESSLMSNNSDSFKV